MHNQAKKPEALLLIANRCPYCSTMLEQVSKLLKDGEIARLQVVNLSVDPDFAQQLGVQSVPWLQIGKLHFEGLLSPLKIMDLVRKIDEDGGIPAYFTHLLTEGQWKKVEQFIHNDTTHFADLVQLFADPSTSMQVRLGITTIFEEPANQAMLDAAIPAISALLGSEGTQVRADACYALGLTQNPRVIPFLENCLQDTNQEVREIATEELAKLKSGDIARN